MRRKKFEELTLADDFMFNRVMAQEDIAKRFLEELLGKRINKVTKHVSQSTNEVGYDAHSVRFDVEFVGDGTVYDIEMQQRGSSDKKEQLALCKRVRYYHSAISSAYLQKGELYSELPPAYVIFVCMFDPFGYGYAKYTQKHVLVENGVKIDDGETTIYLNAGYALDNAPGSISKMLKYLVDPEYIAEAQDDFVSMLDDACHGVIYNTQMRRDFMSLQEMLAQERAEGKAEGKAEGIVEGEARGEARGVNKTIEDIIRYIVDTTGCSVEEAMKFIGRSKENSSSIQKLDLGN